MGDLFTGASGQSGKPVSFTAEFPSQTRVLSKSAEAGTRSDIHNDDQGTFFPEFLTTFACVATLGQNENALACFHQLKMALSLRKGQSNSSMSSRASRVVY